MWNSKSNRFTGEASTPGKISAPGICQKLEFKTNSSYLNLKLMSVPPNHTWSLAFFCIQFPFKSLFIVIPGLQFKQLVGQIHLKCQRIFVFNFNWSELNPLKLILNQSKGLSAQYRIRLESAWELKTSGKILLKQKQNRILPSVTSWSLIFAWNGVCRQFT